MASDPSRRRICSGPCSPHPQFRYRRHPGRPREAAIEWVIGAVRAFGLSPTCRSAPSRHRSLAVRASMHSARCRSDRRASVAGRRRRLADHGRAARSRCSSPPPCGPTGATAAGAGRAAAVRPAGPAGPVARGRRVAPRRPRPPATGRRRSDAARRLRPDHSRVSWPEEQQATVPRAVQTGRAGWPAAPAVGGVGTRAVPQRAAGSSLVRTAGGSATRATRRHPATSDRQGSSCVTLYGGNDGLNTVIPSATRPTPRPADSPTTPRRRSRSPTDWPRRRR